MAAIFEHAMAHDFHDDSTNATPILPRLKPTSKKPPSTIYPMLLTKETLPRIDPLRQLPKRDATEATLEDNYVRFILYCNPYIPLTTDTEELRRGFHALPKADGKQFQTWTLFGLIKRLENKELETWIQLAELLGVERPDPSKGGSAQKVQQYAVRLKRWLHAYHIDAFFQYCLGIPNAYYTELPPSDLELNAQSARDGVPAEEDHAIRALLPEWRPKRGRKKVDPSETDETGSKRGRATSSTTDDLNTSIPLTAPPSNFSFSANPLSGTIDPWQASTAWLPGPRNSLSKADSGIGNFWADIGINTPLTQFQPLPSISAAVGLGESPTLSPAPSSTTKSQRKKHYPIVSAAWNTSTTANGKMRGRPAVNKTVQQGPYITFPATQKKDDKPEAGSNGMFSLKWPAQDSDLNLILPAALHNHTTNNSKARPDLQVRVPPINGNHIRLATPPPMPPLLNMTGTPNHADTSTISLPRVLINGDVEDSHPPTTNGLKNGHAMRVHQNTNLLSRNLLSNILHPSVQSDPVLPNVLSSQPLQTSAASRSVREEPVNAHTSPSPPSEPEPEQEVDIGITNTAPAIEDWESSDDDVDGVTVETWRRRAKALRRALREKEREMERMRVRVMQALTGGT